MKRLTTVSAALALMVLVPFALLAVLVTGDWSPLHTLDATVTSNLHDWALTHPHLTEANLWWSAIFSPNPLRVAALILAVWLYRRHARRLALWVVTTMTVGGLLGILLKLLIGRHRPDLLDPVARAAGFSFPSGHALNAALTAGVFVLVLLPLARDGKRLLLWTAAAVVTVVTGLTRIVIGVHWTSDVVAGWLLGIAVVAITAAAFPRLRPEPIVEEGLEPDLAEPRAR
ncbi:phosphatase PAP2 family protein [Actinoplanes friuliensis]|jgi:membrane-associated phospholipid phosphatase|uniref:Phosphatidic acid phosphatase type 2 domain-containing protein 1B n=1 Tax=Actinoplanes friuliensis DSM 7358 TaxID=1246995 RepID=U5VUK1_9ACTN|nr:phosphatase PAP2 family protein [Actinoplanes friuliensis]AGZ40643.1 Phosphatidic acid phosphatase type 2 domain-containing protein 1B [Actinoplanes friuliensis DSM 7358]